MSVLFIVVVLILSSVYSVCFSSVSEGKCVLSRKSRVSAPGVVKSPLAVFKIPRVFLGDLSSIFLSLFMES